MYENYSLGLNDSFIITRLQSGYICRASIFFKCTSTSLFTGGTFLLKFEQFS